MKQQSQQVINALQDIVADPQHDETRIARYFTPDYQQCADGNLLDYRGFVKHMALLKSLTKSITVTILAIAEEANTVFTHHHVYVIKHDGQQSEIEVMARFTLCAQRIARCDELTRLIRGAKEDHDLGSRN